LVIHDAQAERLDRFDQRSARVSLGQRSQRRLGLMPQPSGESAELGMGEQVELELFTACREFGRSPQILGKLPGAIVEMLTNRVAGI
jgi:hypothetical protein